MLMINGKKASLAEKLVTIIIVVAVVTMIILTVQRFYAKADDKQAEVLCQESVAARAASVIQLGNAQLSPFPLLCRTIDEDLDGQPNEVMEKFASMAERCWWMFGEGRYEEILKDNYWRFLGLESGRNMCFMCYAATISSEDLPENGVSAEDLLLYLSREDHPRVAEATYLEYIQSHGGPGNIFITHDIEERSSYGVAYLSKLSDADNFVSDVQQALIGAFDELELFNDDRDNPNRDTGSIVIGNLRELQEQGNCIDGIGGR